MLLNNVYKCLLVCAKKSLIYMLFLLLLSLLYGELFDSLNKILLKVGWWVSEYIVLLLYKYYSCCYCCFLFYNNSEVKLTNQITFHVCCFYYYLYFSCVWVYCCSFFCGLLSGSQRCQCQKDVLVDNITLQRNHVEKIDFF